MASVGLAMLYMTSLSGQADFSYYAWARVFQTIGLPFVFVPITSGSYSGLPPEKTGEASSLINVARNLGGSIGISVTTTIVARSMQVHQNYLADHLVPSSSAYQNAMAHAANSLTALGVPASKASMAAFAYVTQVVQQQATLLAFIDVFRYVAVVALVMAPVAPLLLPTQTARTVGH
jgi:MFS transporter, DHA2 family, multidrug resistance protein